MASILDGGENRKIHLLIRVTLLACLLAFTLARPAGDTVAAAPAQVADIPPQSDILLVQPRGVLNLERLEQTLTRLGYDVLPRSELLDAARIAVTTGSDAAATARRLAATGLTSTIEADARVRADRVPDDTLYALQSPYLDVIRAPQAWEVTIGDPGVLVAVVDTGIDTAHPDLASRIWTNSGETPDDGMDNDGNGCIDDVSGCSFVSLGAADPSCDYQTPTPNNRIEDDAGHGTFVAGVTAASGNDALGVAGVAWDVRLLPVKVLDCTETGRISDAAAGIRYAARSGARIIVVAFGSNTDSRVLREATAEATGRYGALVVASAGNDGASGRIHFPAGYPGVLGVAGTGFTNTNGVTDYGRLAAFSNFSPAAGVLAPALGIVGPIPRALCGQHGWRCIEGQPYARASGTSFAAPLVAGAAALLYSQRPGLTAAFAISLLTGSASALPELPRGQLDAAAALARPLYGAGLPGASRASDGPIPGPAKHQAVPPSPTATPPSPPPVPTAPPRLTPVPPNTGGGE